MAKILALLCFTGGAGTLLWMYAPKTPFYMLIFKKGKNLLPMSGPRCAEKLMGSHKLSPL